MLITDFARSFLKSKSVVNTIRASNTQKLGKNGAKRMPGVMESTVSET